MRSDRSVPHFLAVVLATALLAAGCSPTAGDGPESVPDRAAAGVAVPDGVLFAAPRRDRYQQAEQHPIVRRLLALIEATPAGERIRIEAHSFSLSVLARALVAAHERGVHVQVVTMDKGLRDGWRAPEILTELGRDLGADSFVAFVPHGLHEKIWSFSRTAGVRDVVLVGSMNLTYESVGQYTDVIAYRDRPDVRRVTDARFAQVVRELPVVSPRAPVRVGGDRWWFFPLADPDRDPVEAMLRDLPAAGTRVRVVMHAWLEDRGLRLARLVTDLAARGAEVQVVLGRSVGPRVRDVLQGSAVDVREGTYRGFDHVHHKLAVVSWVDAGRRRGFVLTGSDNWTSDSLDRAELLVRRDGMPTVRRYDRWVDRLVARSERESR